MYCYNCMTKLPGGAEFCPQCGKSAVPDEIPHHLAPQTVLNGKYLVGNSIGEGGFGITYVGLDLNLNLKIAIKEFFPNGYANRNNKVTNKVTLNYQKEREYFKNGKEQFLREARSLAKFSREKGIVDVRDFFTENDTAYIIMDYVDGETLSQRLKRQGVFQPDELFRMMLPIMRSLEKIHSEGIIHRDISPDNIKISEDGSLTLMDFGSARYFTGAQKKTMSIMLKPGFAPYEQYSTTGNQGPWTDVYGLCATIYKCITGKTPPDSLNRTQRDPIQTPSDLGAAISEPLQNVLMYGLAIYPENRCQNMTRLIELSTAALQNPGQEQTLIINSGVSDDINRTRITDERYKTMFGEGSGLAAVPGGQENVQLQPVVPEKKKTNTALVVTLVVISVLAVAIIGVVTALLVNSNKQDDSAEPSTTAAAATEAPTSASDGKTETTADSDKVRMIDVTGKKLSDATGELEELGFKVETKYQESEEIAEDYVISQSIEADREIKKGSTILLYVAKEPQKQASVNYESNNKVSDATYFSSASASSVLPDQQGHNYSPQNVLNDNSACWVENASGCGIGEWIKLDLPEAQRLSGLRIINGYVGTEKQYAYNSKIKKLKIEFSDGQSTTVDLKVFPPSERNSVQVITLSQPVVTEYVKLTIMDAEAGDCPDTCLSYVAPF